MNLNELRDKAYQCAVAHGWHETELSNEHCLCLAISELMEAVEADRKGIRANVIAYKDLVRNTISPNLPEKECLNFIYERTIKGSVEEELADVCIRLLDLAGLRNIDFSDISFPISNSAEHIESRKKLSFTEWAYDVVRVITGYKGGFPIGYLFIGILQEICCMAKIINVDIEWHIEQKINYNESRPYKHAKKY